VACSMNWIHLKTGACKTMENIHTYPQTATQDYCPTAESRTAQHLCPARAVDGSHHCGCPARRAMKSPCSAAVHFISFLLFLGRRLGLHWGYPAYQNSGMGVAPLLGFTFFMGLMLSASCGRTGIFQRPAR